ncbi:MAG: SRPBCC domain-containing protein, partial [Gemmatimonadaceae bacterium]
MMTTATKEPMHKSIVTKPADREIRIEREFAASRERVWQAFTDPKLLAQWWGRGNKLDIEQYELERGGHWRFVEHGPEGVSGFEGRMREVTPMERLVQTFEWDGMPGHVIVNIT